MVSFYYIKEFISFTCVYIRGSQAIPSYLFKNNTLEETAT